MKTLVGLAVVLYTAHARAACPVNTVALPLYCDTLTSPVYLQVGDTQQNLMQQLGHALRDNASNSITMVWVTNGSCTNVDQFYNHNGPIIANAQMQWNQSTVENPTWTAKTLPCTCTNRASLLPDIGNSALFVSSCTTTAAPNFVHATNGPVQAYVAAVPKASDGTVTKNAITFEEAYFVFGFGMAGMVSPWTDETQMFIRSITKSTLLTWAANISVPGAKWKGTTQYMPNPDSSKGVVAALQASPSPNAAIGILGAEVFDSNRATLDILAFRAQGQYAAYYPDSTSTSHDKQNVRDGHYTVWSPTVWMDNIDPNTQQPTSVNARYVVDLIAGHDVTPAPSFDAAQIVAHVGLVPDCAMRVQRSFDGGPLSLYRPPTSCTCAFTGVVDANTCATCPAGTCASGGTCRGGYCEEF
jgi:hypothetical protein